MDKTQVAAFPYLRFCLLNGESLYFGDFLRTFFRALRSCSVSFSYRICRHIQKTAQNTSRKVPGYTNAFCISFVNFKEFEPSGALSVSLSCDFRMSWSMASQVRCVAWQNPHRNERTKGSETPPQGSGAGTTAGRTGKMNTKRLYKKIDPLTMVVAKVGGFISNKEDTTNEL